MGHNISRVNDPGPGPDPLLGMPEWPIPMAGVPDLGPGSNLLQQVRPGKLFYQRVWKRVRDLIGDQVAMWSSVRVARAHAVVDLLRFTACRRAFQFPFARLALCSTAAGRRNDRALRAAFLVEVLLVSMSWPSSLGCCERCCQPTGQWCEECDCPDAVVCSECEAAGLECLQCALPPGSTPLHGPVPPHGPRPDKVYAQTNGRATWCQTGTYQGTLDGVFGADHL